MKKRAENECRAFSEFEKVRFEVRGNPNSVTVERYCNNCNLYTPVVFVLDEYIGRAIDEYYTGEISTACPNCKNDDSLKFPILI